MAQEERDRYGANRGWHYGEGRSALVRGARHWQGQAQDKGMVMKFGVRAPKNSLRELGEWAAGLGYKGVQIPTFRKDVFDLALAAESRTYCDEVKGMLAGMGLEITELSTHRQAHLVAMNPAYAPLLENFGPPEFANDVAAKQNWAREQLVLAAKASGNLGLKTHVTFSGHLLWPFFYPYPPAPAGL